MTSYSVLRSAQRATIIATWPGPWFDHSANITSLGDSEQASYLASVLTRLSEDAWDAAAFLDASPVLESGISTLIQQLRGPADKIEPVSMTADGYRHAGQWSFTDAAEVLRIRRAGRAEHADPPPADHHRRRTRRRRR